MTNKDMKSEYDTMLLRDNTVPIHIRNLQLLITEVYKTKWELNPSFMKEIFVEKHSPYRLRKKLPLSTIASSAHYVQWLGYDIFSRV